MGVKDLWTILTPICERKPIWELQDKTIAIDLSAWICDSSTVAEHCSQKNMYLRNLFFRTSYLLLLGVKPIFVLEGKAPVLKHDTIEKRQQAQGRSAGRNVKAGSRARLKGLQTQCAALLSAMGLKCIQGDGEAEAFCALLNQAGLVDGVVTQDSDVFLYGGVKVYRHFNTSCAGGGSVDTYEMAQIHSKLGLGRHKLIALSLLCGCDYNKGVNGVGKESALKFFQSVPDEEILARIQQWRQNTRLDAIDVKKDKTISAELKCELQIRAKAIQDESFPCQEVMDEFLQIHAKELPQVRFQWNKPNISQFLKLADIKLAWDSTYALEKALPLLTRWHLTHNDWSLTPAAILSAKTTRGIKGFVVKWEEFERTTEEPQALFADKYPRVVQTFAESKTKGKKRATKKNKENENPAISATASQPESSEEPKTKGRSRKVKNSTTEGTTANSLDELKDESNGVQNKCKGRSRKAKASTNEGTTNVLDELNEDSNDVRNKCDEKKPNRVDDKATTLDESGNEIDRKSDENQTVHPKKKQERKKKETTTRRKGVASEKPKDKPDSALCESNRNGVDIRRYFKTKTVEKPALANDSREMLDESMNLLNGSMHGLSIEPETGGTGQESRIGKTRNVKCDMTDTSSIEALDTGRVRKDNSRSARTKRDLQNMSFSDNLDIHDCFLTNDAVTSDELERGNWQNSKHCEDASTQNNCGHIGRQNNKLEHNGSDESIHLNQSGDILDFSFETACRIMTQKNKELGLNQSLNKDENVDKFNDDSENFENRLKETGLDHVEGLNRIKDFDEMEDINRLKDHGQIEGTNKSEALFEPYAGESKLTNSRQNQPHYLEMTDFIMSLNDSEEIMDKDESFQAKLDSKNTSLDLARACAEGKPAHVERTELNVDMGDYDMSVNTSEVMFNESLVPTDTTSGISLKRTNLVDLKDKVSAQPKSYGNKISQNLREQTGPCSAILDNVKYFQKQTNEIITDHVDRITENISYMSFTEDTTSSPCRVNKTHETSEKSPRRTISNCETPNTSSQSSSDKFSRRKQPIDYTKFTPNNFAWNASSPLMTRCNNSRPSLIGVHAARVSNISNCDGLIRVTDKGLRCESPLRIKYQSGTQGTSLEIPSSVKSNRFRFARRSPGPSRDNSLARGFHSIGPVDNSLARGFHSIGPVDNSTAHQVHSIAAEFSESSPMVGSQAADVSFDLDDFESDEGIEDLSGIIDNIVGQQ